MADIIYLFENTPYFNITNKCPCRCTFCIRNEKDAVGQAKALWHKSQPTFDEIKSAVDAFDWTDVKKAVFCGYGEPTSELELLLKTAKYVKEKVPEIKLRLNTNGLSDLINNRSTAKEICSVIDSVSVSLNEVTSEKYDEITRNIYPGKAFDAMLKFTADCVNEGCDVKMTVVDVISPDDIEKARALCEKTGASFRVRQFIKKDTKY